MPTMLIKILQPKDLPDLTLWNPRKISYYSASKLPRDCKYPILPFPKALKHPFGMTQHSLISLNLHHKFKDMDSGETLDPHSSHPLYERCTSTEKKKIVRPSLLYLIQVLLTLSQASYQAKTLIFGGTFDFQM